MIETIQGQPAQGGSRSGQAAGQAKGSGERHDGDSFTLEGAVAPRGRDPHGEPGKNAARIGDPAATAGTAARDASGKAPGTFVAGLVSLDDAEPIFLGKPVTMSLDVDSALRSDTMIDEIDTVDDSADDARPEPVAGLAEGGEANASTPGIVPTLPAPQATPSSMSRVEGEIASASAGPSPKDTAKLAAATTSTGAAGVKGPAVPSGMVEPALQTAAAQANPTALRNATPLRQATATSETATTPAASADGADTLAAGRPVSQMAQGGAAIERPATLPAAALAPTAEAAQQAATRGTIDEALEEVQADRHAAQPQARAAAPSRAGVDHLALGRMYAPPGATPVRDFAMQVSRKVASGATRFQIRLDPPELGRVDINLEMKGDNATLRLVVERSETLDFLARDARTLERALQDAGVKADAGQMEFSLGQDGREPSDRDADDRSRSRSPLAADDTVSDGPRIRTVRADALVDLVI